MNPTPSAAVPAETFSAPPPPRGAAVLAVCLGLLAAGASGSMWGHALRGTPLATWQAQLATAGDLLLMLGLLKLALRCPWSELLRLSGLHQAWQGPARWALAWALPVLGLALVWLPLAALQPRALFWNGMAFPFAEEWLYRGLAMAVLMQVAHWRWWQAALLPALAFGLVHWGQGQALADGAGVVALTGAGGLLFGWLLQRWNGNLWAPVFLHMGLNALWILFDLGDNALGGWAGNLVRGGTLLLALGLLRWMAPPHASRPFRL